VKKVGAVYKFCHRAAGSGADLKHLCHFVKGTYVYVAQAENNGNLQFNIVCHDQPDTSIMCHPLRPNDTAFLAK